MTTKDLVIVPDEKAVEAGQVSQSAQTDRSQACIAHYEPHKIADLARQGRLYVLADGLSGSSTGYIAAQYAIKKVIHSFYTSSTSDPQTRLLEVFQQANSDIFEQNVKNPQRRPMTTTLTVALIHNNKLLVADVGDNRLYVVWGQDIEWLNQGESKSDVDESPVVVLPQPKSSKPDNGDNQEGESPPPTSLAERLPPGLGLSKEITPKIYARRLFAGDTVVMCSGGLVGYISEKEITRAVNLHPPEQASQRLIALARERDYHDRSAISIIRVLSQPVTARPPVQMTPPAPPQWADLEKQVQPQTSSGKIASTVDTRPMGSASPQPWYRPATITYPAWNGRVAAMVLGTVLVVCVALILATRALLPADPSEPAESAAVTESVDTSAGDQAADPTEPNPAEAPTQTGAPAAASSSNSPVATPDNAAAFTSPVGTPTSAAAAASDVVQASASPTPTPTLPPLPTIDLPANCTNRARFIRDVTVPDGTQVAAGEAFEKAWMVLNAETCPFGPGYTVRFMNGDSLGAASTISLRERIEPDENGEIRIPMVAPPVPGSYRSEWQLHDLSGEPFGPDLYLEIEVVPPDLTNVDAEQIDVLYDFIENAGEARWSSGNVVYNVSRTDVNETLPLPAPQGLVVSGQAQLRGNQTSDGNVLLTYPDQESGFIEGVFPLDFPLQPTDTIAAEIGFPKLSILSDDGVTFEVAFTPAGSEEEQIIFSRPLQYADSPVTEIQPLGDISPGATGSLTLRVLGRESLSQDWAIWISARLVRP